MMIMTYFDVMDAEDHTSNCPRTGRVTLVGSGLVCADCGSHIRARTAQAAIDEPAAEECWDFTDDFAGWAGRAEATYRKARALGWVPGDGSSAAEWLEAHGDPVKEAELEVKAARYRFGWDYPTLGGG